MQRKWFRYGGIFLSVFFLYLGGILVHGTLTDWRPGPREQLLPLQPAQRQPPVDSALSLIIWNVGYGGLGEESDFFYDSGGFLLAMGQAVRPPLEVVDKNVEGMERFIRQTRADFFLLQEVDSASRRSYYTNQLDSLRREVPDYGAFFAPNYRVGRVPLPLLEPWRAYGRTLSGLLTLTRPAPTASERLQFPGEFGWPTRIFQLDRCAAIHRYPTRKGPELVVLNVHLSAHDSDGALKRKEMAYLRDLVQEEYAQGNYVIVGGDWNQCPPHFPFDTFSPGETQGYTQFNIDPDFLPEDWQWIYDPTTPTNRKTRAPYKPGETFTTVIDFYLLSPNVRAKLVKTLDHQFRVSDHQPVYLEVELL